MKKFIFTILTILFISISNTKYVESSDNKITVIYNSKDPILPDLPKNCCNYYDVHKFKDKGLKSKTVILSGHGEAPVYVGLNVKEISKIISSFEPELIVLNTCFGASSPILEELAKKNDGSLVVAPPYRIYSPGYIFWNDFFNEKLNVYERAKNIVTKPYYN